MQKKIDLIRNLLTKFHKKTPKKVLLPQAPETRLHSIDTLRIARELVYHVLHIEHVNHFSGKRFQCHACDVVEKIISLQEWTIGGEAKLYKQISKFMYEKFDGAKLPKNFHALEQAMPNGDEYKPMSAFIRADPELWWGRYDMGQSEGSCFWGERSHDRQHLNSLGNKKNFVALSAYKKASNYTCPPHVRAGWKGIGRVLLVRSEQDPNCYILTNCYGSPSMERWKRLLLSFYPDLYLEKCVDLDIYDEIPFYCNSDGYLINRNPDMYEGDLSF